MLTSVQRDLVMIASPVTSECVSRITLLHYLKMRRCQSLAPHRLTLKQADTMDCRVVFCPTLLTSFSSCYYL